MRFQYIPEYTVDRNPGERLKRKRWAKEAAEIEDIPIDAARQLGTISDVASADLVHYDTLVLERQHDYDSSGLIEGSTGQARGQAWTERFHGAAAAAANRGRRALGARSDPQVYRGGETLPTRAGVATQGLAQGRAGLPAIQPMGFLRARSLAAQMQREMPQGLRIEVVAGVADVARQYDAETEAALVQERPEAFYDAASDRVVLIAENFVPGDGESLQEY